TASLGRPATTDLRLPAAGGRQGRLVGPDGRPAAGVRLAVVRLGHAARETIPGDAADPPPGWPAEVVSDGDGRFRVDGVAADEPVWLQVQDDRFALATFPVAAAEPAAVTLAGPRVLTGRVVADDTGRPLAGARLSVLVGTMLDLNDYYTRLADGPTAAFAGPPVEL